MKRLHRVFRLVSLACIGGLIVRAQITGELRGRVSDATGAAIPKATVTLTSLETRQVRTQTAAGEGEFSFNLLGIGSYQVQAQATGFTAEQALADVKTGEITSVNFRLRVGPV